MTGANRPRSLRAAQRAWPSAYLAVLDTPTVPHLDTLCALLDVMDAEIVRRWKTPGHADRLSGLAGFRAAARQANLTVTAAAHTRAKDRALQNLRKRVSA